MIRLPRSCRDVFCKYFFSSRPEEATPPLAFIDRMFGDDGLGQFESETDAPSTVFSPSEETAFESASLLDNAVYFVRAR